VLDVTADFMGPLSGELRLDDDVLPFVEGLALETSGAPPRPLDRRDAAWTAACTRGCRAHYRVRLADAARTIADVDTALLAGGALFSPPSAWLLRPASVVEGRCRFHVIAAPGSVFVTGVRPITGRANTYEAKTSAIEEASFAAFGAMRVQRVAPPAIDVAVAPGVALSDARVLAWARTEMAATRAYFARVPDDRAVLFIAPGTQDVTRGKTVGDGGASVLIRIGTAVTPENLLDDWVLAHELIHVGSPSLERGTSWFSEGLATYAEPVARARAGLITPEKFWTDLVEGLPQGLPAPGDHGLARTEDTGRIYWGGALYFLLADIEIRERTRGERSLDDVVRGVAAEGVNIETVWTLARMLDEGDRVTGTRVLHELHDRMAQAPGTTDLGALWLRLGVEKLGATVRLDDRAPLAGIRRAITHPQ
jgi:hypothetical protein